MTPIGDFLTQVWREETVDPSENYTVLGARWYGEGLFKKVMKSGQEICAKSVFRVHEGNFVYTGLFAWKGSFAVATKAVDGAHVSNEFRCFTGNPKRIDTYFLWFYFLRESARAPAFGLSTGVTPTSRNRLKESSFLRMKVPLPPLAEQRRVVARIEAIAAEINEARALRQQAIEEAEALLVAMAHRADLVLSEKESTGWKRKRLADVIQFVDDSHKVHPDRSYPNLGIYSFGRGLFRKPPIGGLATSAKALRRVKAGQFIHSRLFAFEGAYGRVTPEFDGTFVSQEYPTFNCDQQQVRSEFLAAYFKPAHVWKTVAAGSKGLDDRRQRVQPAQLMTHELWLPPISWQNRLAEVQSEVDAMKNLQADTAAELDALLPAILDKAFKGDL